MTVAELTPTVTQKTYLPNTGIVGTPVRIVKYLLKVTKATQNDWIAQDTYAPGTLIGVDGLTIDGSGDGAQEAPTYSGANTNIVLAGSTTGTTYLEVTCIE